MHTEDIINFFEGIKREQQSGMVLLKTRAVTKEVRSKFEEISRLLIAEISVFDNDIKNVDVKDCVFRNLPRYTFFDRQNTL